MGGGNEPLGLGAADFDGDGKTDLAVGAQNGTNPGVFFLEGAGTGAFAAPAPLGGAGAQKAVAGDFNGDGRTDIAAGRAGVGDVVIIKRNATGFDPPASFDPDGPMGSANGRLATADLDGDGILDLAVPNTVGPQASKVSIGLGHGDATFETASNELVGGFPRQVAVGDLNGDGNPDLVTSNSGAGNVSVLLATPPAVTVTPTLLAFGNQLEGMSSAERTITVRNDGAPRLRPTGAALEGPDASQFSVSADTCAGANLAIGATCTVGVKFTPAGGGPRSASLKIATNGAGSPHTVELTGKALASGACANTLRGTTLPDTIAGTLAGDKVFGLAGNDKLNGLRGADCLNGGRGNDKLNGGSGRDRLTGGAGRDRLNGGKGRNRYRGGAGKDRVNAVNGAKDRVDCGAGRDLATVDRKDRTKHCERVRRRG
jgi:Ca2+-binding RTX toxin-like protein